MLDVGDDARVPAEAFGMARVGEPPAEEVEWRVGFRGRRITGSRCSGLDVMREVLRI